MTYRSDSIVRKVERNEQKNSGSLARVVFMCQQPRCNIKTKPGHGIIRSSPKQSPYQSPLVRRRNIPSSGQLNQQCHRRPKRFAALQEFCLIRVV